MNAGCFGSNWVYEALGRSIKKVCKFVLHLLIVPSNIRYDFFYPYFQRQHFASMVCLTAFHRTEDVFKIHETRFPLTQTVTDLLAPFLLLTITERQMRARSNHRKSMKAETSRHLPQKFAAKLELVLLHFSWNRLIRINKEHWRTQSFGSNEEKFVKSRSDVQPWQHNNQVDHISFKIYLPGTEKSEFASSWLMLPSSSIATCGATNLTEEPPPCASTHSSTASVADILSTDTWERSTLGCCPSTHDVCRWERAVRWPVTRVWSTATTTAKWFGYNQQGFSNFFIDRCGVGYVL